MISLNLYRREERRHKLQTSETNRTRPPRLFLSLIFVSTFCICIWLDIAMNHAAVRYSFYQWRILCFMTGLMNKNQHYSYDKSSNEGNY